MNLTGKTTRNTSRSALSTNSAKPHSDDSKNPKKLLKTLRIISGLRASTSWQVRVGDGRGISASSKSEERGVRDPNKERTRKTRVGWVQLQQRQEEG